MRDRIRKLLASRPLRITLLCLGIVLLLGIITAVTLNGIVVGSTKAQILPGEQAAALEDVDCVIVLGAGLRRDGTPSDMLRDRLAVGVALYEAGLQAPYLMSGDNRTDDYNEVGAMQRWAVEHGMSDKVIFLDPYGLCTYDSLWRLSQLDGIDRIVIVTQEYHLYRALYVADALGLLWAETHPGATVLVGYDTRHNSAEYARVAASVLASFGLTAVVSDRPCPTPCVSWCCSKRDDAVGVVMLTASERSCEYGGLIVRGADGGPVSREFLDAVEQHISLEPPADSGEFQTENFVGPYLDDLVTLVDGPAIASASLSVVVDPMYGAGSGVLAQALGRLGCQVTEIHGDPCEDFCGLHPEPCDPWADECEEVVSSKGASMGFLIDCDGDRAGVVDENGNILLPHELSPLVLGHLVENRGESGRVVVTLTCSARIARQAERLGCELTSVPVGFSRIY